MAAPDPEPDGTRMQVVKGFEALTWDFVEPALGPVYAFDKNGRATHSLRDMVTARWPRWDGRSHCWRCAFGRSVLHGTDDLCRVRLDPAGRAQLYCYDRDGAIIVAEEGDFGMVAVGAEPVRAMFEALAASWGPRIAAYVAVAVRERP